MYILMFEKILFSSIISHGYSSMSNNIGLYHNFSWLHHLLLYKETLFKNFVRYLLPFFSIIISAVINVLITKYLCTSLVNFLCHILEAALLDQRLYLLPLRPATYGRAYSLEIVPTLDIIIQYLCLLEKTSYFCFILYFFVF